jgi:hypothetical protein
VATSSKVPINPIAPIKIVRIIIDHAIAPFIASPSMSNYGMPYSNNVSEKYSYQ